MTNYLFVIVASLAAVLEQALGVEIQLEGAEAHD